jgi:hypothetical protein
MSASYYLFEINDVIGKKKILSVQEQKLVRLRDEIGVLITPAVDHGGILDAVIVFIHV